jgi:hypothetical protein
MKCHAFSCNVGTSQRFKESNPRNPRDLQKIIKAPLTMALNPDGTYNDKEQINNHDQYGLPLPNLPGFCQAENDRMVRSFDFFRSPSTRRSFHRSPYPLIFSEVAPVQENGNQPDNPKEKNPYSVFIPDCVRTHWNVHTDFFICPGCLFSRFGHN